MCWRISASETYFFEGLSRFLPVELGFSWGYLGSAGI
jgi:hypothetical protein